MALYDTGVIDAMYLAGLVADGSKMTRKEIQAWAEKASSPIISEYTVAWVASESEYGQELAMEWINSGKEHIAASGWGTLSALVAIKEDAALDMSLARVYQKGKRYGQDRGKTQDSEVLATKYYFCCT